MAILTRTWCGARQVGAAVAVCFVAGTFSSVSAAPTEPQPITQQRDTSNVRFIGCFKDTSVFDLDGHLERSATNTPMQCIETCAEKGFAYAAVQYGESCLCGHSYGRYGPATNCNYPCTGDGSRYCGGYSANSVFWTGDRRPEPPSPPTTDRCGPADPQFEYNTDRRGGDYKRFSVTAASCPQQCAKACAKEDRCQAWTFVAVGHPSAGCWLKKSQPLPTTDSCCVSGTVTKTRVRDWTEPR